MDILFDIIESLNKEEIRFFKLFAHRQQAFSDRKDLRLLDMARKYPIDEGEDKIYRKLYGNGDKNAFYRLKNRLAEDLNKSLFLQHYNSDDLLYLYHLMMISRIYASKSRHNLALHYLKKAENRALKIENLEILDIIYGEFIQLSHQILSINPENYVDLRKKNSDSLNHLRQMDDMLAVVSYRLKVTQNFGEKQESLLGLLEHTTNQFMQDQSLKKSARFRFKLYSLVSQLLLQRKDYVSLESYLATVWRDFSRENLFNRNNHETKLQILTYLVNSLFKNGKTKQSLDYAEQLHLAMKEFNNLLYERFEIFYYNALVNNYSTFDLEKAITILHEMQQNKNLQKVPFYEIFIYLNLATSYFDLGQFNQAIRNLNKLYLISSYKNADASLKFKIAVAELMIRFEIGDMEFWQYRHEQITRANQDEMKKNGNRKEVELLVLLNESLKYDHRLSAKNMKPKIIQFIDSWKGSEDENEIIKCSNWLNEKILSV